MSTDRLSGMEFFLCAKLPFVASTGAHLDELMLKENSTPSTLSHLFLSEIVLVDIYRNQIKDSVTIRRHWII